MSSDPREPFASGLAPAGSALPPNRRGDLLRYAAERETFLYDREADAVHVLNPTALAVWELCDGTHTPDQIADALAARFPAASLEEAGAAVQAALATLEDKNLIRWPTPQEEVSNG